MSARRLLAVLGATVVLALAFGFGVASGSPHVERAAAEATDAPPTDPTVVMGAMHGSPAMQEMREAMGAELAAKCDAMHEQMIASGTTGMMGSGMMGSGVMGSGGRGDHLAHHPAGTGMWS